MIDYDETVKFAGKSIERIYMDEDRLTFVTNSGMYSYEVDGLCCSRSYFFDFYGVENLIGSVIESFEWIELSADEKCIENDMFSYTDVYGYRFNFLHEKFGIMSAAFSFRNDHNGYYGGYMEETNNHLTDEAYRVTTDKIGE